MSGGTSLNTNGCSEPEGMMGVLGPPKPVEALTRHRPAQEQSVTHLANAVSNWRRPANCTGADATLLSPTHFPSSTIY